MSDEIRLSPEAVRAAASTGGSAFGQQAASIDELAYHVIIFLNDDPPRVSSFHTLVELKQYLARLIKEHCEDELYAWPFYGTLLRISHESPRRLVSPDFSRAVVIDEGGDNIETLECDLAELPLVDLSDGFLGPEWLVGGVPESDDDPDDDDYDDEDD